MRSLLSLVALTACLTACGDSQSPNFVCPKGEPSADGKNCVLEPVCPDGTAMLASGKCVIIDVLPSWDIDITGVFYYEAPTYDDPKLEFSGVLYCNTPEGRSSLCLKNKEPLNITYRWRAYGTGATPIIEEEGVATRNENGDPLWKLRVSPPQPPAGGMGFGFITVTARDARGSEQTAHAQVNITGEE